MLLGMERGLAFPLPEEDLLLERARRGDREAFGRLVEAHLTRVWGVVWRILRHREDSEDVVQETFLTAFQSLQGFRGEASLATWLCRIAASRALNHLQRASERLRRASQPLEDPPGDDPGTAGAALADRSTPTPIEALEAKELMTRLSECLERLPAAWRAVLALRESESMPYEEIAAALDLAPGTVRSRLARARLALRRCVGGEEP
jgi:RNA polymerase sigma-70 factor (ECF subfamily)